MIIKFLLFFNLFNQIFFSFPSRTQSLDMDLYVDYDMSRARATNSSPSNKIAKPARKKFAVPPVKVACLEW